MDVLTHCSLAISCSIIVLIYAWKFLNWIWIRPKKLQKLLRQQGLNGNSYTLLYGDFTEIKATAKESKSNPINLSDDIMARASPIYYKAVQKYGEKCFVWLGPKPAVVISDPEMIREIMSKNYVFQKPSRPFTRMVAKGLVSLETDKWAKHRKLINPAFHIEKLKHMIPSFYLSCGDMLNKWDKIVASNNGSCCELDVWPYLQTMTSDVISRTAFGSSYVEGRKIFQLQTEQVHRFMEANTSLDIPGYRPFLPTKFNLRTKEITKEIESTLLGIINRRIKAIEESSMNDHDLLGLLLDSNFKEIKHGNGFGMSMKEVIEECKIFYFAGQETTAALLVWTMILLSKYQDWQARARDEILQVFGRGKPDYQELKHLKIVSMIFHEVLRLYPPSVTILRTVMMEMAVGDVILPEGIQIMMHTTQMHRHCKFWGEDANEFKPERFSEGVSKVTQG
ncbi:hypothetical protein C2S52_008038 [Perilla frutescens var. hirtella]|nr:hypothetical protein C2S52_008038 [Perilla frutescens var. hirtella]